MPFRFRSFAATVVALSFVVASSASAQSEEPKTELGKKMSTINTAFKAVGRQIEDPTKNASTLEQIGIIETNAKAALALEPEKKGQIPAGDQAKFVADYQAGMKKMLATVDKLKAAVKAGKNTEALAIIDEMKGVQRDSHREFRIRKPGGSPI